jgi:hypothetical protein
METSNSPWRQVDFNSRKVAVLCHPSRGLIICDPAGQKNLPPGKVRLYLAKTNELKVLFADYLVHFADPMGDDEKLPTDKQCRLALHCYASFLNPRIRRPEAIDCELPKEPYYGLDSVEFTDDETDVIRRELSEQQEGWARSESEGWFYSDD